MPSCFFSSPGVEQICHHVLPTDFCQADWVKERIKDTLNSKFLDNTFTPPIPLPLESQEDSQPAMPPQPPLNILAWNTKVKSDAGLPTLKTPDRVLQTWHDHSNYGQEFQEFLASCRKKNNLDMVGESTNANNRKRVCESSSTGAKKIKTDNGFDLPDTHPLIHQIPVHAFKYLELTITVGNRIFLKNLSKEPTLLKEGGILCGFYKGKGWAQQGGKPEATEKDVKFELSNCDQKVLLGNQFVTLLSVIQEKRKLHPADAQIGYHSIVDEPTDGEPQWFKLNLQNTVYFRFDDIPAEETAGKVKVASPNVAGVLPVSCWDTWATHVTWSMRWPATSSKGLQPVQPYVILKRNITLPAESIVELKALAKTELAKKEEGE